MLYSRNYAYFDEETDSYYHNAITKLVDDRLSYQRMADEYEQAVADNDLEILEEYAEKGYTDIHDIMMEIDYIDNEVDLIQEDMREKYDYCRRNYLLEELYC